MINIWTDGSCDNNFKRLCKGGYGVVVEESKEGKISRQEYCGGRYENTTSARMEIMGVLAALRKIKKDSPPVNIYCDNQYVVNSIKERWVYKWQSMRWLDKKREDRTRQNSDLWMKVIVELKLLHRVEINMVWVRGHDGNKNNEVADQLARKGGMSKNIFQDLQK